MIYCLINTWTNSGTKKGTRHKLTIRMNSLVYVAKRVLKTVSNQKENAVSNPVSHWELSERFFVFKDFHKKPGREVAEMTENVLHDRVRHWRLQRARM